MSEQPDLILSDDDVNALELAVNTLPDLTIQTDVIEQALDFIYANGGEHLDVVLDDIQRSTNHLVRITQRLGSNLVTAVVLVKTLREQRDAKRQALDDLETAIALHDIDHPTVGGLIDSLSTAISEEIEGHLWDILWEHVIDRITDESPLDYTQANRLLGILTEGEVEHDSPVWGRITAWIEFVDREIGYIE